MENGFLLSLNNFEMITKIQTAARQFQKKVRIHLKVDTGMGRFGVFPEEIPLLAKMALDAGCIEIDGIFSHYASIDDDPECSFNAVQRKRFEDALDLLRETGVEPNRIHCSNSAGALNTPLTRYNMVRIGKCFARFESILLCCVSRFSEKDFNVENTTRICTKTSGGIWDQLRTELSFE